MAERKGVTVNFSLDKDGNVLNYSTNAVRFFRRSTTIGTGLTNLLGPKSRKLCTRLLSTRSENVHEVQVTFLARKKRIRGNLSIYPMRTRKRTVCGYTAIAQFADEKIIRELPEGYLHKKAEASFSSNRWLKRYFRLRNRTNSKDPEYVLDYFNDRDSILPKGSIRIQGAEVRLHFQSLVFVLRNTDEGTRNVALKAKTPKERWLWVKTLNELSGSVSQDDRKRRNSVSTRRSWKDASGRHGGGDDFHIVDLARIAMKSIQGTGGRGQQTLSSSGSRISSASTPFLVLQVLSGRSLNVGTGAVTRVTVILKGSHINAVVGMTEIGYGPEPIYDSFELRLAKERKLHNALANIKLPSGGVEDLEVEMKVTELKTLTEKVIGTCTLSLDGIGDGKEYIRWCGIRPSNSGDLKVSAYFSTKIVQKEDSDISSEDEAEDVKALKKKSSRSTRTKKKKRGDQEMKKLLEEFDDMFKDPTEDLVRKETELSNIEKKLESSLKAKAQKIEELEQKLSKASKEVLSLMTAIGESETRRKRERKSSTIEIEKIKEEKSKATCEIENLKKDLESAKSGKLQAELELKRRLIAAKRLFDKEKMRRKKFESLLAEKEKNASLKRDSESLHETLKRRLSDLTDERDRVKEAFQRLQTEITAVSSKQEVTITSLQKHVTMLENEKKDMKAKIDRLHKKDLEYINESKEKLDNLKSNHESEKTSLENQLSTMKSRVSIAETERDEITESMKKLNEKLDSEVKELNDENSRLEVKLKERDADLDKIRIKNIELLEESKQFGMRERDLSNTMNKLQEQVNEWKKRDEVRQSSIHEEKSKTKQLSEQLNTFRAEEMKLRKLNEELKDCTDDLRENISQIEKREKDLAATVKEMEMKIAKLSKDLNITEDILKLSEDGHSDTKSQLDVALGRIQHLEQELQLLRKAIERKTSLPRSLLMEAEMFAKYFNFILGQNQFLTSNLTIPLKTKEILHKIGADGLLISEYLNHILPNSIDNRALHFPEAKKVEALGIYNLSNSARTENFSLIANTLYSIGIGGEPSELSLLLINCPSRPREAFSFLFSLVSFHLLQSVQIVRVPYIRKSVDDTRLQILERIPTELLTEWVRYHTKENNVEVLDTSWHNLLIPWKLVNNIAKIRKKPCKETEMRLELIGAQLRRWEIPWAVAFLIRTVDESKVTWHRANLLFSAAVFNATTNVAEDKKPTTQKTKGKRSKKDEPEHYTDINSTKAWLNALNIKDTERVHDLFVALKDGILLLKVFDSLAPGCVRWRKVELKPDMKIKRISNCELAIKLAKGAPFNFSLVSVGGSDIAKGNRKLTMALLWQMRRYQLLSFLHSIFQRRGRQPRRRRHSNSKSSSPTRNKLQQRRRSHSASLAFNEDQVIQWANETVETAIKNHGLPKNVNDIFQMQNEEFKLHKELTKITSLHDQQLSTSLFYLLMLWAKSPDSINWKFITTGMTTEQKLLNASYAITVARKLGGSVFVFPQDLVEVRSRTTLLFLGAILALDGEKKKFENEKSQSRGSEVARDSTESQLQSIGFRMPVEPVKTRTSGNHSFSPMNSPRAANSPRVFPIPSPSSLKQKL